MSIEFPKIEGDYIIIPEFETTPEIELAYLEFEKQYLLNKNKVIWSCSPRFLKYLKELEK